MIEFKYYGKIKSKGRPRHRIVKGQKAIYAQTYTDKQTQEYEEDIKMAYLNSWKEHTNEPYKDPGVSLKISIEAFIKPPKATSKKKLQAMLEYEIRPTTKPDADNIAKAVLDSLNAVAYPDDKQICDLHITKYYAEQEYMIVRIFTIEEEFKWKLEYLSKKYSKN